jgi:hypothetical protein
MASKKRGKRSVEAKELSSRKYRQRIVLPKKKRETGRKPKVSVRSVERLHPNDDWDSIHRHLKHLESVNETSQED